MLMKVGNITYSMINTPDPQEIPSKWPGGRANLRPDRRVPVASQARDRLWSSRNARARN